MAMVIGVDIGNGESKTVWTLFARDESHPDAFRILGSGDDGDSLERLLPDSKSQQSGHQNHDH